MKNKRDELVLYGFYQKYIERKKVKKGIYDVDAFNSEINDMTSRISLLLTTLDSSSPYIFENLRDIFKAKGIITQYALLRKRAPELIRTGFKQKLEKLIKIICELEAEMISRLRQQEIGGSRIDIKAIFEKRSNMNRLGNMLARDIIAAEIHGSIGDKSISWFFITETGKKYHSECCRYCKGRATREVPQPLISNLRLSPCSCITEARSDASYMTAFVDESIHQVPWGKKGHKGKVGSYSYIICRGIINNENEIRDEDILFDGVDFIGEDNHLERVTEAAISKVLLSLLYDYDFNENVQIFTDNQSVVKIWSDSAINSRLVKEFRSVTVTFIPRKKNTKADRLGRSRVLLDIPVNEYQELLKKDRGIKELEKIIRKKEEQIQILRRQEEVIVVKHPA